MQKQKLQYTGRSPNPSFNKASNLFAGEKPTLVLLIQLEVACASTHNGLNIPAKNYAQNYKLVGSFSIL